MTPAAARRPILVGANPLVSLFDGDRVTGLASVWRVEWSEYGKGDVVVLWHDGRVRAFGEHPALAYRLAQDFTRHFPEAAGLPWPEPEVTSAPVTISLDLRSGLTAGQGRGVA